MTSPDGTNHLVRRHALPRILELVEDFRVTIINGARQAGKTTLLQQLHTQLGGSLVTLDDADERAAARSDPHEYIEQLTKPIFVDEVQRAGDPFVLAVKAAVDRSPQPGSFILSGSTRFLTVPTLSESLAGRAALLELWPLSVAERVDTPVNLIDQLLSDPRKLLRSTPQAITRHEYMRLVCVGGFPEVISLRSARSRATWFSSYVTTITQREVREIARIRHLELLPRLLRLLAALTAQELNTAEVARSLSHQAETVRNYLPLLETVYLIHRLPAWSRSLTAKVKRHPKVHLTDTGLAAWLTRQSPDSLARPGNPAAGALLETFVVNEIAKQRELAESDVNLWHYRDRDGYEIDCVIETLSGHVVGVEVKAAASVDLRDFRHLTLIRDKLGDEFAAGVVFYTGPRPLPFGDRLLALPISMLWGGHPIEQTT